MRGRLYLNSQMIAGEFSGFTRGLAYAGRFYYVGQMEYDPGNTIFKSILEKELGPPPTSAH